MNDQYPQNKIQALNKQSISRKRISLSTGAPKESNIFAVPKLTARAKGSLKSGTGAREARMGTADGLEYENEYAEPQRELSMGSQ